MLCFVTIDGQTNDAFGRKKSFASNEIFLPEGDVVNSKVSSFDDDDDDDTFADTRKKHLMFPQSWYVAGSTICGKIAEGEEDTFEDINPIPHRGGDDDKESSSTSILILTNEVDDGEDDDDDVTSIGNEENRWSVEKTK